MKKPPEAGASDCVQFWALFLYFPVEYRMLFRRRKYMLNMECPVVIPVNISIFVPELKSGKI